MLCRVCYEWLEQVHHRWRQLAKSASFAMALVQCERGGWLSMPNLQLEQQQEQQEQRPPPRQGPWRPRSRLETNESSVW